MENKKLDQLFQSKLARHETAPSNEAWAKVSSELNGKKRPAVWMRVAAAIILLAVSTVIIIQLNDQPSQIGEIVYITPTHPVQEVAYELELPLFEEAIPAKTETKNTIVKRPIRNTQVAQVESVEVKVEIRVLEAPELTSIHRMAIIEMPEPKIIEEVQAEETLPQLSVQITYIASNTPTDSTTMDDKTKMGRLLAKARDISPGDMLASIRETKDNFFNGINN